MSLPKGQQPEHECYIDIFYKFPLFWIFEPIQQKAKKCFDIGTKPPGEYDDDQKQLLFLECDNRHEHIDFKTLVFLHPCTCIEVSQAKTKAT